MKIVAIYGSTHQDGNSRVLAQTIAQSAQSHGAEVTHFDVLQKDLPLFRTDKDFASHEGVQEMRTLVGAADGFIVVSPEYHGCMSNAIKNFFDFHYQQFAGKVFAIATATGGSLGVSCNSQMRIAIQHCHGWALPYQVGVKAHEFVDGEVSNEKAKDRLERLGRDLVVYGQLLKQQFDADKTLAAQQEDKVQAGFAGWYV